MSVLHPLEQYGYSVRNVKHFSRSFGSFRLRRNCRSRFQRGCKVLTTVNSLDVSSSHRTMDFLYIDVTECLSDHAHLRFTVCSPHPHVSSTRDMHYVFKTFFLLVSYAASIATLQVFLCKYVHFSMCLQLQPATPFGYLVPWFCLSVQSCTVIILWYFGQ